MALSRPLREVEDILTTFNGIRLPGTRGKGFQSRRRWSDVDLEGGRLAVRRALIPSGRDVIVSEPKTVKGRCVIAIDPGTVDVMKAQAARRLNEQNDWDEAWVETGLVFTREDG